MNKQDWNKQGNECNYEIMVKLGTREEWGKRPADLIGKIGCPLCDLEEQKPYILWKGDYWFIIINKYPYTQDRFHIMAAPIEHLEFSHELPEICYTEMKKVHDFVKKYFEWKEYFSFTRESFWDRSLTHLHMHFLPGKLSPRKIMESIKEQEKT